MSQTDYVDLLAQRSSAGATFAATAANYTAFLSLAATSATPACNCSPHPTTTPHCSRPRRG